MMTALQAFDESMRPVNQLRDKMYGPPTANFERIQQLRELFHDCPDPAIREALEMMALKLSRMVNDPYNIDCVIDIAGYARQIAKIIDVRRPQK